jgi:hypothetical protein
MAVAPAAAVTAVRKSRRVVDIAISCCPPDGHDVQKTNTTERHALSNKFGHHVRLLDNLALE